MQIRRSSYPATDEFPPCAFDHEEGQCLHRHGNYKRFADVEGDAQITVMRFLCKYAGRTISVLPDHLLPYRTVHLPCVEEDFDQRCAPPSQGGQDDGNNANGSEIKKGCLRRAWCRFADQSRRQSLTEFFGQRIALTNTAEELWRAIRLTAGNLGEILLELALHGKSLLGDYRCLKAN